MKKKILKGLSYIVAGYVLLVALHFLYLVLGASDRHGRAFEHEQNMVARQELFAMSAPSAAYAKSGGNYATLAFKSAPTQDAVEQKYEKIGSLQATTDKFDESESQARATIKQFNALIQGEAVNSSEKLRGLQLTIGVPPDNFDGIVAALKTVGKLESFNVTKTDKTNDFLELKANRTTLEKTRDSLISLKSQGGKIEELVKLEKEILDLEGKIQGLGVQLGQFDKVNEFCTVRFSLAETVVVQEPSPYLGYLVTSIEWAGSIYLAWLGILGVGVLVVIFLLIVIDKSRIFRSEPAGS